MSKIPPFPDVPLSQGFRYAFARDHQIRTAKKAFAVLNRRNVKRALSDGTVTLTNWQSILELCGNSCLRCGASPVTQDHVLPVSLGGWHSIYNLQPLCQSCNSWKHDARMDFRPDDWPFK